MKNSFLVFTILVTSGCISTPIATVFAEPTVITEATRDINGDGKIDKISIQMVSGKKYRDQRMWAGAGWKDKYEGKFEICVNIVGESPTRANLNKLMFPNFKKEGDLFFWSGPWQIHFSDYNQDADIDFNLGQYGSSNGWDYRLFTIDSSGVVSVLPIEGSENGILVSDRSNSTSEIFPIRLMGGFLYEYYDNVRGDHILAMYSWDRKTDRFTLVREETQNDLQPAPPNAKGAGPGGHTEDHDFDLDDVGIDWEALKRSNADSTGRASE